MSSSSTPARRFASIAAALALVVTSVVAWGVAPAAAFVVPACGQATGEAMCLTMHNPTTVTLPTFWSEYLYVSWGEGPVVEFAAGDPTNNLSHTYLSSGDYTIKIWGNSLYAFSGEGWLGSTKLTGVTSWGDNRLANLDGAFSGTTQLATLPASLPSTVTSLYRAFEGSTNLTADISGWDTSNVTTMGRMFYGASTFNQDISGWNTSNVIDMSDMFRFATAFNQDVGAWNTGSVTDMSGMFEGAIAFNRALSSWNVSNVTDMSYMFASATAFNRSLGGWSVKSGASLRNALSDMGMSPTNYSASLQGWAAKSATGVALGEGPKYLSSAAAARATLVNRGWTIVDGGPFPPPSQARSVSGAPRNRSVLVSWLPPEVNGGFAISSYKVVASPGGSTCTWTRTIPVTPLACTVVGLTNGTSYTFTVKATNGNSRSSTSPKSAAVIAGVPTQARALTVSFPMARNAKVTWTSPQYIGSGSVIGYRLRWCAVGGLPCSAWVAVSATTRSATTGGRTKNQPYRFEIQARNASGWGLVGYKWFQQGK